MGNSNGTPVLRPEDIEVLSKTSGKSEEEIRSEFNAFVEQYPSGKINKKGFRSIMEKTLPQKNAKLMEKRMFRLYDANNDGSIDFSELMTIYNIMAEGSPDEILTRLFRVFDVNGDGHICKKELKNLMKDMYGLVEHKSKSIDEEVNEMMSKTAGGDDKITLEEFIDAAKSREEYTKLLTTKLIHIFEGEEDEEEDDGDE